VQPVINVPITSMAFTYVAPNGASPAPQSEAISTTPSGGTITVTPLVTTPAGGSWLGYIQNGGNLTVTANPAGLGASATPYAGTLTLSSPNAAPVVINVTFLVSPQPTISSLPASLTVPYTISGTPPGVQTLAISSNPTGQNLTVSETCIGVNFLGTTSLSAATAPANLTFTPSVTGLTPGTYSCVVTVAGSAPSAIPASIPVSLTVNAQPVINAPTASLGFSFLQGGANPPSQTVTVTTTPAGLTVVPTVSCNTSSYLTAAISGTTLTATASPTGLAAGNYNCSIVLNAAGAGGSSASPVTIPTTFVVQTPVINSTASSLTFTYIQGSTAPAAQTPTISTMPVSGLNLTATATTTVGGSWLTANLSSSTSPATLTVTASPGSLAPTTYSGNVAISSPGAATLNIPVTFTITAAANIPFFNGQIYLGNNVYYLTLPDSNLFGYYGYLSGGWIYHVDLGYEYIVNANDGHAGIYLFDLASGHWWYTNAGSFPYIYDFTLNSWLYYFPAGPGHYTTNPRSFANLTTGLVITM